MLQDFEHLELRAVDQPRDRLAEKWDRIRREIVERDIRA
jgi:hypothetical protein